MAHSFISTFRVVLFSLLIVSLAGCGREKDVGDGLDATLPRAQTLIVGGFQWGPPESFNPLDPSPAWPMRSNENLVYESMFGFNQLTGELEPVLGVEYSMDDSALTVALNDKARWHDGRPVTSADVVYTFDVHRRFNTPFNSSCQYIGSIEAPDPQTVVFRFSRENYNRLVMKDIISSTPILPAHIFTGLEDSAVRAIDIAGMDKEEAADAVFQKILEFRNVTAPVGSGPYSLQKFDARHIVLQRVETYWGTTLYDGRLPAPRYIVHVEYPSNDEFNRALQDGKLDVSQSFCPEIWNYFSKGVGTWFKSRPYFIPGTIPSLIVNHTKPPMNDPVFRQAIAASINYAEIAEKAMYGYSPPLQPGFIINDGTEKQFFNAKDAARYGVVYNPARAKELLRAAGYSWGADSMLCGADGRKIETMHVSCPAGWSDWESVVKIAADGMRGIGIDVREKFVEESVWWDDLTKGLFDITMQTPLDYQSPSLPWSRFEAVMSSAEYAPPGKEMYVNWGRYRNPVADSLLAVLPRLTDDAQVSAVYRALNVLFMKELPVIPLMYRPWFFYAFSTKHWTNFPTESNPYAPPQCLVVGGGMRGLWEIKPR